MTSKNPIERLRQELKRPPLFSERNGYIPLAREPLLAILDEIEAQYIKLPVDADGVPIRPGDEIQFGTNAPVRVYSIGTSRCDCGDFGWFGSDGGFYGRGTLSSCRHVNPDTVEGLLAEYVIRRYSLETAIDIPCSDMTLGDLEEAERNLAADYAERIRKAVEDE